MIFDNLKKSIAYTLASKFPEQVWACWHQLPPIL